MGRIKNEQVKKYLGLFKHGFRNPDAKDVEDKDAFYSFKREVRNPGNEAYRKLSDAMHEIQTDSDTVYNQVVNCLELLDERTEDEPDGVDIDDLRDDMIEGIDSSVSVYTTDLTKWLARTTWNVYYLGEALQEFGPPKDNDGFKLLALAQYACHSEIWHAVFEILEEEAEEEE